jgi:hypothetical protein
MDRQHPGDHGRQQPHAHPGAATVAWVGSTPPLIAAFAPGAGTVTWTGSTPTVTGTGDLTLTPGAATVAWSGATAPIQVVPDIIPVPPAEGGGAWHGEEDTSLVEVRNLTLRPGPAVVHWTGMRPDIIRKLAPLRVRLPLFRRREPEPTVQPPAVHGLQLRPDTGVVAWTGARPDLQIDSYIPISDYQRLQRRVKELEAERDEEALLLAALTAD